jgi:Pvc16 N-terminal domain
MLHHLDDSLEAYLRALVPLPSGDVDVSFDTPDREWGSGVTRPTINLFLWDVRRSARRAVSGLEQVEVEGRVHRRQPAPRVEFRYLVTAWASDNRDQHQLLGAVLRTIVARPEIAAEHLRGDLVDLDPLPVVELAASAPGGSSQGDLWSALDGQLKAGLDLLVTMAVDTGRATEGGPPVEELEVATADRDGARQSRRRAVVEEQPAGRVGR